MESHPSKRLLRPVLLLAAPGVHILRSLMISINLTLRQPRKTQVQSTLNMITNLPQEYRASIHLLCEKEPAYTPTYSFLLLHTHFMDSTIYTGKGDLIGGVP